MSRNQKQTLTMLAQLTVQPNGSIISVNSEFNAFYGNAFLGKNIGLDDLLRPQKGGESLSKLIESLPAQEESQALQMYFIDYQKEIIPVNVTFRPKKWPDDHAWVVTLHATNDNDLALTLHPAYLHQIISVFKHLGNMHGKALQKGFVTELQAIIGSNVLFLGELQNATNEIKSIAFITDKGEERSITYTLANAPCQQVLSAKEACFYAQNVADTFPDNELFRELKIQGYVAVPLLDSEKQPLGVIVALFNQPIKDVEHIVAIMNVFAPKGINILTQAITARLSEQTMTYKSLVNSMNHGLIYHSISGEVLICNQASQDLLGFSKDQLQGKTPFDPTWQATKDDGSKFSGDDHPVMVTLRTQAPCRKVLMNVSKSNGQRIWLSIDAEPVFDAQKQLMGAISAFSDVSDIVNARNEMEKQKKQLQYLIDKINQAILIADSKGKIVMSNTGTAECTGYTPSELIGQSVEILLPASAKKHHYQLVDQFFATKQYHRRIMGVGRDVHCRKKNGKLIPIEITLSEINFRGVPHVLCSLKDLSQDKRYLALEVAHKKVTDSINYAQRIQKTMQETHNVFSDDFNHQTALLYRPKDVVSGDFYWYQKITSMRKVNEQYQPHNLQILAVADCTGHGVPGAFMSTLGHTHLNEIIKTHHIIEPDQVLSVLNDKITQDLLKNSQGEIALRDGMDIGIVMIDTANHKLHFSGAKHCLYQVVDGQTTRIKGSSFSIGGDENTKKSFQRVTIDIQDGMRIYMTTDGFYDQFGGPLKRKYMRKRFMGLLERYSTIPMNEQSALLAKEMDDWMGDESQTDDVLVVGVELEA